MSSGGINTHGRMATGDTDVMLYNILVVDDNKQTAQGLAQMVRVLGHTVSVAYGPRMALQLLNQVVPDAIFLDINMPGVNGIEVLRYLRRDPYTAQVPVVIVSANDSDAVRAQALQAGANHYIVKPPTIEQIENALVGVLPQAGDDSAAPEPDSPPDSAPGEDTPPAPRKKSALHKLRRKSRDS